MRRAVELSDVHDVVFVLENGSLVVVDVEIVGSAEDGHYTGKPGCSSFAIHAVPGILGLVSSNNGKQIVLFEKGACRRIGEEEGTTANTVVDKIIRRLFLPEFFQRIGPEDITHQAVSGRFPEAVDLHGILESLKKTEALC